MAGTTQNGRDKGIYENTRRKRAQKALDLVNSNDNIYLILSLS